MDEAIGPAVSEQLGSDATAALARLGTLDGLDTASHVAVFELVQVELAAALADIDMPSGGAGAGAGAAAGTPSAGHSRPVPGGSGGFDRRPVPGRPPR